MARFYNPLTGGGGGEPGPAGPPGPQGEPGIQGDQGIQGIQGIQGEQGIQGIQGEVGPAGGFGSYGSFYDTQTQTGGSVRAIRCNTTDFASGISMINDLSGVPNRISFSNLGYYNIAFSAQLSKTGGTTADVYVWLRHNGVDVPDTATMVQIGSNNGKLAMAWNFFVHVNTLPQDFQIMWYTADTNTSILAATDAQTPAGVPGIPSMILTVNQVG